MPDSQDGPAQITRQDWDRQIDADAPVYRAFNEQLQADARPLDSSSASILESGTYRTYDGTIRVWVDLSITPLPRGARWQTLKYRRQGTADGYLIYGQLSNRDTITWRVDDLEPAVGYEFVLIPDINPEKPPGQSLGQLPGPA